MLTQPPRYTSGMKTAISIPDDVYAEAEQLTRRLRKSRSQLYTEAVREYVARHDPESITDAINQLSAAIDTRPDRFTVVAAHHLLERVEW